MTAQITTPNDFSDCKLNQMEPELVFMQLVILGYPR